jgi:wobble nucleotide-excising tRNase
MVVAIEFYETQKKMFEQLSKEITDKIKWEISEIEKLQLTEMTENKFKSIENRKKRIEDFYRLIELMNDLIAYHENTIKEFMKELEFSRNVITLNYVEQQTLLELLKKLVNAKD